MIRAYSLKLAEHAHPLTEQVRIEVSDTGIGIDAEDQEAIFDRFFRVENRVHTLEGTGLGLSIVRNIIEKHHSRVHLVSEVGVGTTFWFDLAVYEDAALHHHEAPKDNPLVDVESHQISEADDDASAIAIFPSSTEAVKGQE
jgi:two-component system sensor histidine kinase NblS